MFNKLEEILDTSHGDMKDFFKPHNSSFCWSLHIFSINLILGGEVFFIYLEEKVIFN